MNSQFMDERLLQIDAKVRQGSRLSKEDGICI